MKKIKMRYPIELRDRIYVKGHRFLSFAKSMGTHATKVTNNVSNKYGQKLLNSAKKSTADAIKTASTTAIQKTVEATGDLIGNRIADKIKCFKEKSAKELQNTETEVDVEKATPKKRYSSPEEKQKIIDELRLV